jgi:hypothetical protein
MRDIWVSRDANKFDSNDDVWFWWKKPHKPEPARVKRSGVFWSGSTQIFDLHIEEAANILGLRLNPGECKKIRIRFKTILPRR